MRATLQAFVVSGVWAFAVTASAQEQAEPPVSENPEPAPSAPAEAAVEAPTAEATNDAPPAAPPNVEVKPPAVVEAPRPQPPAWEGFVHGYFRAPMALGVSPRPGPDDLDGPARTQVSYGPNRTVDANYYSFAYTRLQEQDWAEIFIGAKKKHVEAAVGFMGYWYQAAGFRNNDSAWAPGLAYLKLDTDLNLGAIKPNVALTAGAFWPAFGYFEKYDTYTLGRFRHLGEQLKVTIPFNRDVTLTVVQGFGTARDGLFNLLSPPPYQSQVGLGLLHYEHVGLEYKDYLDVGLHFNAQWTRDPNLFVSTTPGKSYTDARDAGFSTVGGEAKLSLPRAGSLWVSPSHTRVLNGWALAEGGVEVMHALSGEGFATNYLAWNASPINSTGSGSSFNLGFLYENTLSGISGHAPGTKLPDVSLNVFGLLAKAKLDLPTGSALTQDRIGQFKYGADASLQATEWLGFMLRWDEVNYDLDHSGYLFSAITGRVTFSTHFLSGESIYLQYSRYRYGERMVLAGKWPWGQPLVAGSDILQGGPYSGHKPDLDVIKLQASAKF